MGDKVTVLSPKPITPDELEEKFSNEIRETVNDFFKQGMTANWQMGVLLGIANELQDPSYE